MHKLKIRFLVNFLHFLVVVPIEAKYLDPDNGMYDSIEELILEGDQDNFTATAIMKAKNEIKSINVERTDLKSGKLGKRIDCSEDNSDDIKCETSEEDEIEKNETNDKDGGKEKDGSKKKDSDERKEKDNEKSKETKVKPALLRKNPWKAWQKSAAKQCKKACTVAYKDVCSFHDCRKSFKKDMKKQCKISCKDFFIE